MEEFIKTIKEDKFRSTNAAWNNLMLNDPWSVGYVSTLIETNEWKSKEEWESFYYKSGEDRKIAIKQLPKPSQDIVNNFQLIRTNRQNVDNSSWKIKNLNRQFGRTQEDLIEKARVLCEEVKDNGYNLSIQDCFNCVRYRVICESWNGIIIRENNTVKNLSTTFPNLTFKKVTGEIDHTFAVDFEIFKGDKLICAVQIKPESYTWNATYILKARQANEKKNNSYTEKNNIPVLNIIADSMGNIKNLDVLDQFKNIVNKNEDILSDRESEFYSQYSENFDGKMFFNNIK